MKVSVQVRDLAELTGWAQPQVENRPSFPVLSALLLSAEGHQLFVRARNSRGEGEGHIDATVEDEGSVALPAKLFTQLLNKLPKTQQVTLQLDEASARVSLSAGRTNFSMRTMDVRDFPEQMTMRGDVMTFTMPSAAFARTMSQVIPAAATEEGRPALMGVNLAVSNGKVSAVATDTYRLAVKEFFYDDVAADFRAVVPTATLKSLVKTLRDVDAQEVQVRMANTFVEFAVVDRRMTTTLIEAEYPTWQKLVPDDETFTSVLHVNRSEMLEVLNRAMVIANLDVQAHPVTVAVGDDGTVTLSARSGDNHESTESLPGELVKGEGFEQLYNPSYLKQALESTGASDVSFLFREQLKPALFRPVAEEGEDPEQFRVVLMPMRPR